jgi:glycolate oxidase FAD binding subunit
VLGREAGQHLRPETVEAVQQAVRHAAEQGQSVIPWGGGTGQDYGSLPQKADVLLDLSGLSALVAHEYADMTVTVQAGMTLARLQEQLAQHGQFLPLDPPHPEAATIGGILATNACGPLRLGYGTARDWLIGLKVVDAQGRLVKGGGRVVKNVTGYDLPKLHIGALGTLGVMVEATFKVSPKPETTRTLVAQASPASDLKTAATRLWHETRPVSLLLHEDTQGRFLVVLYHGSESVTQEATQRATALVLECRLLPAQVYSGELVPEAPPAAAQVRLSSTPAESTALHDAAFDALGETAPILDSWLGIGALTLTWEEGNERAHVGVQKALLLAKTRGVRFTLLHGSASLRGGALESLWFPAPTARVLHERVKEALDPHNTLNPGRFVCGI